MLKYGKVKANKLWFHDGKEVRYVFHNETVVITERKTTQDIEYLRCFVPSQNASFWIQAVNIHAE
jgi:hypothetical protein